MTWKTLRGYVGAAVRGGDFLMTFRSLPEQVKLFVYLGVIACTVSRVGLQSWYEATKMPIVGKLADFAPAVYSFLIVGFIMGSLGYGTTGEIMLLRHPNSAKARELLQASPYLGVACVGGFIGGLFALALFALVFGGDPLEKDIINALVCCGGCFAGGIVSYSLMYRRGTYARVKIVPLQVLIDSRPPLPIKMIKVDANGLSLEQLMESDGERYRTIKLTITEDFADSASLVNTIRTFEQSGPSSVVSIILTVEDPDTLRELEAAFKTRS